MKKRFISLAALLLAGTMVHAQNRLVFKGKDGPGAGRSIILISGDEEYRSEESCPMLAKILSERHGFDCTVLFAIDPEKRHIDPNNQRNIPGMNALAKADLVIIGTRFRQLPNEDYRYLADFLNAGKPIMGFRTATHAFTGNGRTGDFKWSDFGLKILGETWINHHGAHKRQGTRGVIESANTDHPVLNAVTDVFGPSDVYGIRNLDQKVATILLRGAVTETLEPVSKPISGPKNNPMMPLAWLREYTAPNGKTKGKAFCTTMGASVDFVSEDLRRLMVNTVFYLTNLEVPEKANVDFIDPFKPTFYGFNQKEGYYERRNLRVSDFSLGSSASTGLATDAAPAQSPQRRRDGASRRNAPRNRNPRSPGLPSYPGPLKAGNPSDPLTLPIQPQPGETIALIGNMLGERMLYFGHFETLLHRRFPDARITVRNMCNPGDTPGFRASPSRTTQWAFPGADKFHPDLQAHFGIGHYPSPDEWLTDVKADTIIAFFGYNESFDGLGRVENFKAELAAFVDHTKSLSYNGKSAPRLILVTPIAYEDRSDTYDLPRGIAENERLSAYAQAVLDVAKAKEVGAVDLFTPVKNWFSHDEANYTINGCHLSDAGYAKLAPVLMEGIYSKASSLSEINSEVMRKAVLDKDWFWMNDYRMLNGVHVYGRRWKPYGNVNYPEEIEKMRQMTRLRDERIWAIASGESNLAPVADHTTRPLTPVETNFRKPIEFLGREKALEQFTMRDGFKVELFASEQEFPDLENPVQMSFDNKGRLWVAVLPSYPHYKPGDQLPDDKLLIFEDTDNDGRADRQTVFADGLNLPIGFEIAAEGVYLSQEPHLCLLIDSNGDDRADRMEKLLTGFDTHDTHHAISAYAADAAGAFYLCEGRFLHSQVETPYGPQRMTDGGVWRFNPSNWRLERYSQADYSNPWGIAFDEWDQCYISDASPGQNWWGLPVSAKLPHGLEIPKVGQFAPKRARPTSGSEFVSSRHFPEDLQGHFLINNTIGFLGTSLHDVWEEGSGFFGSHAGDLISSSDPNFRPVDLEFAPDGSLYIVDWHNPLIGHMQHSARDPNRDQDHGRIYRITYPARPLVKPVSIAGASIPELLEHLKLPEYRTRYRTRRELRGRPAAEVVPAVKQWVASLDRSDVSYDHHLSEALWATWGQNRVEHALLNKTLNARTYQARAAAVHVLRYTHQKISNSTELFLKAANDPHPRVRLEAIVAASWLDNPDGARIALEALKHPFDRWMGPVFETVMKSTLKDDVQKLEAAGRLKLADNPTARDYLAGKFKIAAADPTDEQKSYGPTRTLSKADLEEYMLGREVFFRDGHCTTCHQANGKGMEKIYPPLTKNPWLTDDDERLIKVVLKGLWGSIDLGDQQFDPGKGVPPMPGFSFLTDEELAAVLNYVRNSFGNDQPFISANTVERIREQAKDRRDFYTVEEIMEQHPIPGWEKWAKATIEVGGFE